MSKEDKYNRISEYTREIAEKELKKIANGLPAHLKATDIEFRNGLPFLLVENPSAGQLKSFNNFLAEIKQVQSDSKLSFQICSISKMLKYVRQNCMQFKVVDTCAIQGNTSVELDKPVIDRTANVLVNGNHVSSSVSPWFRLINLAYFSSLKEKNTNQIF